ncbi:tigger transposable element-derived 6-like [Brachionus plicatilis]|uniref:Tigger transposable element-derived 6-like n=1 Tax=Brachionus plicatilis TaxID=10195 RepID=A0A3M7PNE7_BRAPC|nr:tigger transposable element-derived 6-like [Brachionus plicatilis]
MSTQIKRKPLSLEEKLEISNDFNKNNLTVIELVKKYNTPQSTVSSILKAENQEKIKNLYENNLINPSSKRIREALDRWFKSVLAYKNITLNGPLIQAQAIKYATMLNQADFKACIGWLNGFKKRHNITFKLLLGKLV